VFTAESVVFVFFAVFSDAVFFLSFFAGDTESDSADEFCLLLWAFPSDSLVPGEDDSDSTDWFDRFFSSFSESSGTDFTFETAAAQAFRSTPVEIVARVGIS
jgi:hypothetical protein